MYNRLQDSLYKVGIKERDSIGNVTVGQIVQQLGIAELSMLEIFTENPSLMYPLAGDQGDSKYSKPRWRKKRDSWMDARGDLPQIPDNFCCYADSTFIPKTKSLIKVPSLIGLGTQSAGWEYLAMFMKQSKYFNMADSQEVNVLGQYPLAPDDMSNYFKRFHLVMKGAKHPNYHNFEFTESYLHLPIAACRARQLLPNAHFVVVLSDPVQHALLMYDRLRTSQIIEPSPEDFEKLMDTEVDLLEAQQCTFEDIEGRSYTECFKCRHLVASDKDDISLYEHCQTLGLDPRHAPTDHPCYPHHQHTHILSTGMYFQALTSWLEVFPPSRFLIMPESLLTEHPDPAVNKVLSFLGLPAHFFTGTKGVPFDPPPLSFNTTDVEWQLIKLRLRSFYEPYVDNLYDLMNDLGQEDFVLDGWPKKK